MINSHDYRYRWRFTARALCLFDGEKIVGELVRLEGGEWAVFGTGRACLGRRAAPLGALVAWAEQTLRVCDGLPSDASIDRFAVGGGQNG